MARPFTRFAVTRFVNREAVLEALQKCASQLIREVPGVELRLFGSYAGGIPTPRSDVDIAVLVPDSLVASSNRIKELAESIFLQAPVPVEVFVVTRSAVARGRQTDKSLAGTIARTGIPLV